MLKQDYTPHLAVLLAALLSWWLVQWQQERQAEIRIADNSPDFFSNGYYKQEMGVDGLPKSELRADAMEHHRQDGGTSLVMPFMTLYSNRQSPWLIKSDKGFMAADGDNLQLNGNAHIHRDAGPGVHELTINTTDLRVKLSTSYAETNAWAELISPPNKTVGTGMQATFSSPIHITLLSGVKGRYELR